jgi:hypothetical protein
MRAVAAHNHTVVTDSVATPEAGVDWPLGITPFKSRRFVAYWAADRSDMVMRLLRSRQVTRHDSAYR